MLEQRKAAFQIRNILQLMMQHTLVKCRSLTFAKRFVPLHHPSHATLRASASAPPLPMTSPLATRVICVQPQFTTRLMTSGALPVVMHMINRGGLLPPTDERQRAMAAILQVWDGDAQPPSPLPVALASAPMFDLHFISMQLRHVVPNATLTEMSERQIRGAFDGLLLKTRLLPIEPTLQDRISAVSLSLTMESAQGTLKGSPGEL